MASVSPRFDENMERKMEAIYNPPKLLPELMHGKYSRWAERLDVNSMQAVLLAVGEFGRLYSSMRAEDGTFPAPIFHGNLIGYELRVVWALEAFAFLYANSPLECRLLPCAGFSLSPADPAFSREFADRLSLNPQTAWAKGLDENSVALLLWNIGEYCCRIHRAPPFFEGPQKGTRRMRAALRYLDSIYRKVSGS